MNYTYAKGQSRNCMNVGVGIGEKPRRRVPTGANAREAAQRAIVRVDKVRQRNLRRGLVERAAGYPSSRGLAKKH